MTTLTAPASSTSLLTIAKLTLVAGIVGEFVFEVFAFGLGPLLTGRVMEPAYLVTALAGLAGFDIGYVGGWIGHLLAGLILFPLGYLMYRRVTGHVSTIGSGLAWGLILWLIAQGILAPLIGRGYFMGFVSYTWASLFAHMFYGLAVAAAVNWMHRQDTTLAAR